MLTTLRVKGKINHYSIITVTQRHLHFQNRSKCIQSNWTAFMGTGENWRGVDEFIYCGFKKEANAQIKDIDVCGGGT